VLLNVANRVQLEFEFREWQPVKTRSCVQNHGRNVVYDLLLAEGRETLEQTI